MSRRSNTAARCAHCRMHESLCVCEIVPRIETRTRLVLVIHHKECRKTTNTGQLAVACLPNSEIRERGHEAGHPRASDGEPLVFDDATEPVLLYPFDDAVPIGDYRRSGKPVTLIVPDGTWRQASKVRKRVPGLLGVPCVSLPKAERCEHRLRAEAREDGLATIEAIARAMGALEGPAVEEQLLFVFKAMVERTLWARGSIATERVTGGVPEGAERHDPRGSRLTARVGR